MGNQTSINLTVWELRIPSSTDSTLGQGRRFSLSSDHLCLYHDTVDGIRRVTINGIEVMKKKKAIDNGSTHPITYNGNSYELKIKAGFVGFKYTLTYKGKNLPSHLERKSETQTDLTFRVVKGEIEEQREGDKKAEQAGVYSIEVHSKAGGGVVGHSKKRFSEFSELYKTGEKSWGASNKKQF